MRKGRNGREKGGGGREKKIMMKIVATNVVPVDRLERRPLVPKSFKRGRNIDKEKLVTTSHGYYFIVW